MILCHNLARRFQDVKEDYFHSLEVISGSEKTVNGYYTNKVEHYLQKVADRKHALLVRSGSQALHLALLVNDIGAGDEVIITGYSCMASLTYVVNSGATPIFCDVNRFGLIDTDKIEELITPKTKAITGTGLYGDSYNIDEVSYICSKHGLIHINDASQSYLSGYNGEEPMSRGDIACVSFAENKPIPSLGTFGAVLLNDTAKYFKLLSLRKHGKYSRRSAWVSSGINAVPEEDKAAQIWTSTKWVDTWLKRRLEIWDYYDDQFYYNDVKFRPSPNYSENNTHKYVIEVDDKFEMYQRLQAVGIDSECHYPDVFSELDWVSDKKELPNSKYFAKHALSIPLNPHLTDDEVQYVAKQVIKLYRPPE